VTGETFSMSQALAATQLALAREQQITALGGVVAAAAHELGTPLATIKLVASELADELAGPARAARGRAPDRHPGRPLPRHPARDGHRRPGRRRVRVAPLSRLVEEAAAPMPTAASASSPGSRAASSRRGRPASPSSTACPRSIQGLRNLVQNAVDFARATSGSTSTGTSATSASRSATTGRASRPS
jgi:two-component system, sensor histidine kinase RegB